MTERVTLFWFDRNDVRRGILHVSGGIEHKEELRGDDTIEFRCEEVPGKYDRLVWWDFADEVWREHVVVSVVEEMGAGVAHVVARTSLCDLVAVYVEEFRLVDMRPRAAVPELLGDLYPKRWNIDIPEEHGRVSGLVYHMDGLAALHKIEVDGTVEFEPRIDVVKGGVRGRTIHMEMGGRGTYRGARFTYGKNLTYCRRTVLDSEVYTALYGWGVGLPIIDASGEFTGGYTRRLSLEDALVDLLGNKYGKKYVADEAARKQWGIPVGGEMVHRFGEVVFTDIAKPTSLKRQTEIALRSMVQPRVAYEANGALVEKGVEARLGDKVYVVDTSDVPEWTMKCRVVRRTRVFSDCGLDVSLGMGTVTPYTYRELSAAMGAVTDPDNTRDPVGSSYGEAAYDAFGGVRAPAP